LLFIKANTPFYCYFKKHNKLFIDASD